MSGYSQLMAGSTMGDVQAHGIDFVMRRGGAGNVRTPSSPPKAVSLIAMKSIGASQSGHFDLLMSRRSQSDCNSTMSSSAAGALERGRRFCDMPPLLREHCAEHQLGRRRMSQSPQRESSPVNMVMALARTNSMADLVGTKQEVYSRGRSNSPVWGGGPGRRGSSPNATRLSPQTLKLPRAASPRVITRMLSAPALARANENLEVNVEVASAPQNICSDGSKDGGLRGVLRSQSKISVCSMSTCSSIPEDNAASESSLTDSQVGKPSSMGRVPASRLLGGKRAMQLREARMKELVAKEQKRSSRRTESILESNISAMC